MANIINKIISNFSNNKSLYIGENITIAEHMIQTAMLAEKNKCSGDMICSSLLHDYGHFIIEDPNQLVSNCKSAVIELIEVYEEKYPLRKFRADKCNEPSVWFKKYNLNKWELFKKKENN